MLIIKGISLFVSYSSTGQDHVMSLVNFLSDEYNFLNIIMGSDKSGVTPFAKSVKATESDIGDIIRENLFRLDGIVISIQYNLKNWKELYDILESHPNLIIFVTCPSTFRLDVVPHDRVVFRQIFEIKTNPEWGNPLGREIGTRRFVFRNILTEEEFSLEDFKKTYIRDKKIDNFLDNSEDLP